VLDPNPRPYAPPSIIALPQVDDARERVQLLREAIGELGFRWLEAVRVAPGRPAQSVRAWQSLRPSGLRSIGIATGVIDDSDPRMALALGSPLPCVWDIEGLAADTAACCTRYGTPMWLASLRAGHVRSGVTLAVRGAAGVAWVVSLLSCRTGRDWLQEDVVARALLVACFVAHAGAADEASHASRCDDLLTDTQRDILDCLQQGMGDKVIADRLGLTTHNVDYHLRRLRQRFGARNRVQLAQAARRLD
jgi:DNA-binding CsgD family transcriptional regulator